MKGIGVEHHEYRHRFPKWKKGYVSRYNDARLTWRTDEYGLEAAELSCDRCDSLIAIMVAPVSVAGAMTIYDHHLKECGI
jgi:hypothetical protein